MNTYWNPVAPEPRPARRRGPLFRLVDAVAQIIGGLTLLVVVGPMVMSPLIGPLVASGLGVGPGIAAVIGVPVLGAVAAAMVVRHGGPEARRKARVLLLCGFGLFLCAVAFVGLVALLLAVDPNAHF